MPVCESEWGSSTVSSNRKSCPVRGTRNRNHVSKIGQQPIDRAFPASAGGLAHTWTLWSAAWPSLHVRHDRGRDGLNLRAHPRRVSATASASGSAGRLAPCAGLSRHLCVSMAVATTATARDIAQTPPHQDFRTKSQEQIQNASPGRCKKRTNKTTCAN